MIRRYIQSTFRNALRNKVSSIISILGLSTGLASVIIIFLYIRYEASFDVHHSKGDRIFHFVVDANTGNETDNNSETPFPLITEIRNRYPEVETATRIYSTTANVKIGTRLFSEKNVVFAEPEFLGVFDVKWICGNSSKALDDVNEVVLTRSLAKKLFGGSNEAMDKVFKLGGLYLLKITGVVEDPPLTTHLPYCMLVSLNTLSTEFTGFSYDNWNTVWSGFHSYVLLISPEEASLFQLKVKNLRQKHLDPNVPVKKSVKIQPLKEIHFATRLTSLNYTTSKTSLWIISIIGLFTLFIAAFNYLNMTVAHSIRRSREVGIKQSAGAGKKDIIIQFLTEAVIMSLFCLIIAIIIVEIFLPTVNRYLGNGTELSLYRDFYVIFLCLILVLIVATLTGIYPGLIVSSHAPTDAIKSKISSPKRSISYLRNGILVSQFIISQMLVIGTITIFLQLKLIENKDLGFVKENVIQVPLPDVKRAEMLREEMRKNSNVREVSSAASPPQSKEDFRFTSSYYVKGDDKKNLKECELKSADPEYFNLFQLRLVAGELYRKTKPGDSVLSLVVNETLIKEMGWKPEQALGKRLNMGRISGVVKDFHAESLQEKIMPEIFFHVPWAMQFTFIKVSGMINSEIIDFIQKTWEKTFPDQIFSFEIYEDYLHSIYFRENRTYEIVRLFAIVSIILAYLGVFAMVSFLAAQKTHEFCIRKVLGAPAHHLFILVSKKYFLLLLLANVIAWPVSWYLMSNWLDEFAYKINISWWIFAIALLFSILITLLTILFHAVKTAKVNPAGVLKYE